ncbi:hypothetical protein RJT34_11182 [Clitoria ternatea]|uniref:Uncharacterized protein n=1 Tax=Clitoria ternatea TaxID=43366 RepID=A0AAN9JN39_CLITE
MFAVSCDAVTEAQNVALQEKHHKSGVKLIYVQLNSPTKHVQNHPIEFESMLSRGSDIIVSCPNNTLLHLAELPFNPTQHGLPHNVENSEKVPLADTIKFGIATLSLETPLRSLISQITQQDGQPPLCIISDLVFGWVNNVSKSCGISNITFTTSNAYGTLAYFSVLLNLPHRKTESNEFSVPGFPQNYKFQRSQLHKHIREANGNDGWSKFFNTQFELSMSSKGWICNTVEEIEPLGLQLLRKYIDLPVWTIGPLLLPTTLKGCNSEQQSNFIKTCIEWLDLKYESSVLYICFGSESSISTSQMIALAEGLEGSGKEFIWVIRPPFGFDMSGEFKEEWLPRGFEERMRDSKKGLLVHKWGPQLEILSHRSTGVCVELTRSVESVVTKEEVKKVIELVMDQEGKGKEMKEKANEIAIHMKEAKTEKGGVKGSSLRSMHDFVRTILS